MYLDMKSTRKRHTTYSFLKSQYEIIQGSWLALR